ncbi:methyltransferase domain-containing protein [Candidatus Gottesmanbacteria bacterium]|nr:methyltransferase domain-containing protein [Candidatus Gottesmanbacteria bacterium]
MNIFDGDLVLEIGSGDNPNPRADVLCDRYSTTSHERAGGFRIRIDRPLAVADGMRLPFPNQTFDYVICSHIFEHMDDPAGFAREIMRVGKAGMIEVPSAISERVFGWNFHHWFCALHDGVLTFCPKKEGERPPAGRAGFDGYFHRLIAQNIWFRRFFEEHEEEWYTRLEWQGKIPTRIRIRPMSQDEMNVLDEKAWKLLSDAYPEVLKDLVFVVRFFFRRAIRKSRKTIRSVLWWVNKRTGRRKIIESLMRICVCPRCLGKLRKIGEMILCEKCKSEFPLDGVIPILLLPEERKKGW